MSLSPDVRAFLEWDRRLGNRLVGLSLPDQRRVIGTAQSGANHRSNRGTIGGAAPTLGSVWATAGIT